MATSLILISLLILIPNSAFSEKLLSLDNRNLERNIFECRDSSRLTCNKVTNDRKFIGFGPKFRYRYRTEISVSAIFGYLMQSSSVTVT